MVELKKFLLSMVWSVVFWTGGLAGTDLDLSFGISGIVRTDIQGDGSSDVGQDLAIQNDGKIVVAGFTGRFGEDMNVTLIRYKSDGTLDTSFGNPTFLGAGGIVVTDILDDDMAKCVALQEDGKILLGGSTQHGTDASEFLLIRYNGDGSRDTTFGRIGDGVVLTPINDHAAYMADVAVQKDGKIVAVGNSFNGHDYDFAIVRYDRNGRLDSSFGTDRNGIVTTDFGGQTDYARDMAIQADGKIVVVGTSGPNGDKDFALVRYNSDGTLDTSFGVNGDGKITTDIRNKNNEAHSVTLQKDGKILVAGYRDNGIGHDFAVARYNNDGTLDSTFNEDGIDSLDIYGKQDYAYGIAVQNNGKIIMVGSSGGYFTVVRYKPNGEGLDTTFGNDGVVRLPLEGNSEAARAVALQRDGKIVVSGGNFDIYTLRFKGDPVAPFPVIYYLLQ